MKKPFYHEDFRLGVLGGGQLGRMLIREAQDLDVKIDVLDPASNAPCSRLAHSFTQGNFNDFDTVMAFGKDKDLLTIEIEHVNVDALEALQKGGVAVYPKPDCLRIVQDKGLQKQFYTDHGIATAPFFLVEDKMGIKQHENAMPFMQKMRKGGYDGKGVTPLHTPADLDHAFDAPSVLETFVDFEKEISVVIARNPSGETKTFPVVELEYNKEANLVEFLFSPATISKEVEKTAFELANKVATAFDFVGILAVEMFVLKNGEVLVNEVAPRTHNSGHHSIEGNNTSQYMQQLRAILDLPLGNTDITKPAVMLNLLGEKEYTGPVVYQDLETVLAEPGVHVHLYGKADTKPFRKMGHVTVLAEDVPAAKQKARWVQQTLKVVSQS